MIVIISIVVIVVAGRALCYMDEKDNRERQPATPEELTAIIQDIPCAADAFRQALHGDESAKGFQQDLYPGEYGYRTEALSIRDARKLAEKCKRKDKQEGIRRKKDSEKKDFREKQLKTLNELTS